MKPIFRLTTFLTVLGCGVAAQDGHAPDDHAAPQRYAQGVAVSEGGIVPRVEVSGPVHKASTAMVSPDAAWHIGSITKSFTATLVMQQVDRGVLDLDASIAIYLPDDAATMDPSWQALTLRQLLSHTAGVPANAGLRAMRMRGADDLHTVRRAVLASLWETPVTSGSYSYSNIGYVLAGYVLETVTGQTWEDLVRQKIATPLNLTSLGFGAPTGAGTAWGHRNWIVRKTPVDPATKGADNPPWIGPAGTIHLNLADLITWGHAHLAACRGETPDFLSAAACQEMQVVNQDSYGLGWVVMDDERYWHNGSNTMWYAVLSIDPARDRVVAAATNVLDTDRIDRRVANLTDGD